MLTCVVAALRLLLLRLQLHTAERRQLHGSPGTPLSSAETATGMVRAAVTKASGSKFSVSQRATDIETIQHTVSGHVVQDNYLGDKEWTYA
jgi:hypothetical protein